MRFRRPGGAPAKLTLGPVDFSGKELEGAPVIGQPLTLRAARELAAIKLRERAMGVDVFAAHKAWKHRQRAEREQTTASTFGVLARQFIDEHARAKTRRWRETARVLGLLYSANGGPPIETQDGLAARWTDKPVIEIDGHDIYALVDEARRRGIPGLARRNDGLSDARGRAMARTLSKLFSWLVQHRMVPANPCVGIYCPPPPKSRDRILSDSEIRLFWPACDQLGAPFGPLLQILLLTGQRLNEVAGMRRDELRVDGTWHIPGERTKNHRPHQVPLPPLVIELLSRVNAIDGSPYVFTSATRQTPVSGWSKTKARLDATMSAEISVAPWRLHDLRRTAVSGMAELGMRPDVIELTVNHVSGTRGGIAGVYNRSELVDERRVALARWATHVQGIVSGRSAKVTPLRREGNEP